MPIEITTREKIGKVVSPDDINQISDILEKIINEQGKYQEQIKDVRENIVFNLGKSSDIGIKNILNILQIDEK